DRCRRAADRGGVRRQRSGRGHPVRHQGSRGAAGDSAGRSRRERDRAGLRRAREAVADDARAGLGRDAGVTSFAAPETVAGAAALLGDGAAAVAGGTDLVVAARSGRRALPDALVSLHRLEELRGIGVDADGALRIGALTTHADLERSGLVRSGWAALADAAALVGSPATRNAGTVGGNLANASPAMELGAPLLVHEARVQTFSRGVPLADFL